MICERLLRELLAGERRSLAETHGQQAQKSIVFALHRAFL
jgi:hypothetical protein